MHIKKIPGDLDCTFTDINKIKTKLKWPLKIKDGMKLLIKDIEYWKKTPVWEPKTINKATTL